MRITNIILSIMLVGMMTIPVFSADAPKSVSVMDFGAKGDGVADDTAAIQKALDTVGKGGVATLPAGKYYITKSINVPHGATLIGDSPRWENSAAQIIIKEQGFSAVVLGHGSCVKGMLFSYPNNQDNLNPKEYPPTISLEGINPGVENIVFDCAWIGVSTKPGGSNVGQALFRNLTGHIHHIGMHLSNCRDVSRIENVHWFVGGKYDANPKDYFRLNRIGFEFGDVDGIIMTECFMIGGKTFFQQLKYKDTVDDSKQLAHSLGFQIDKCWIEDVENGFIFQGSTGFVLSSSNILLREMGYGVKVDAENLFYNAVINGVQVRTFGVPAIGFYFDVKSKHPRNRLSIADCQVVDGSPAVILKSGAVRANIHDSHFQSVPGQPAIRIEKGAEKFIITDNILSAKKGIEDNTSPKTMKTIRGNILE